MTNDITRFTVEDYEEYPRLSEETCAYSAVLCFDGKPFADASNKGQGGCDLYRPIGINDDFTMGRDLIRKLEAEATAWTIEHGWIYADQGENTAVWINWYAVGRVNHVSAADWLKGDATPGG